MSFKVFSIKVEAKDKKLVEQIQQGNEKALQKVYQQHYKFMTKMLKGHNADDDEAQDIYQEALIVFWQRIRLKKFVLQSKISTYLYSVCLNLWRKELKKKSKISRDIVEQYIEPDYLNSEDSKNVLNKSLALLSETCRKVLMYYYFDEMSMREIADKMGFAGADTAKTRKYKCKQQLDRLIKSTYSTSDFLD